MPITLLPTPRTPAGPERVPFAPGRRAAARAARRPQPGVAAWSLARLLLIACTAIGVAALHTLGHATADPGNHSTVRLVAARAAAAAPGIRPGDPGDDGSCAGDGCTHQGALPGNGREPSHGWQVCLAILSVIAAVLPAAALRHAGVAWLRRPAGSWRVPARSGPVGLPVGLALASSAVLRT